MKWKTKCALGDPDAADLATAPIEAASAIHAWIVGGVWDRIDPATRDRLIDLAARSPDGRHALLWMIGAHDRVIAAALADPTDWEACRDLATRFDPTHAHDALHAALFDPNLPLPTDDDSIRRIIAMVEAEPSLLPDMAARLARAHRDAPRAEWNGWGALLRIAVREPLGAARTLIALHRAGLIDLPQIGEDKLTLCGAVARLPDAMLECCANGVVVGLWEAELHAAGVIGVAVERIAAAWTNTPPDGRAVARAWAVRDPRGAVALAGVIGPAADLVRCVGAHGDESHVMALLKNVAAWNPSADDLEPLLSAARSIPPQAAEHIGLHARLTYEALQSPQRAAGLIAAYRRFPGFRADHPSMSMLVNRAVSDPQCAVDVIRALGPSQAAIDSATRSPDALPRLILAIADADVDPPPEVRHAVERVLADPTAPPPLRAQTAALTLALWDAPPTDARPTVCADSEAALVAIETLTSHHRWDALPADLRADLTTAALTSVNVPHLARMIGDTPELWATHERNAAAIAAEHPAPALRQRVIVAQRLEYLGALVAGDHWQSLDDDRRTDLATACTEHIEGIEPTLRLIGLHPAVTDAMQRQRTWRVESWSAAIRDACGAAPIPDDLRDLLIAHAPRNPLTAVALTAQTGWSPILARNVLDSAYGDVQALIAAVRSANDWGRMVDDLLNRSPWTTNDTRLVNRMMDDLRDGDAAAVAAALNRSPRAVGIATSHPALLAAYLRRFPDALHDPSCRAVWRATVLRPIDEPPIADETIDDATVDAIGATSGWSALTLVRAGFVGGSSVDAASADPETALLYLLWGGDDVEAYESAHLRAVIATAPSDVVNEADRRGITTPHIERRARRGR